MSMPTGGAAQPGGRVYTLLELVGFVGLVVFAGTWGARWGVLVAAVLLIVVANLRAAQGRPDRPRFSDRLARALAAYRGSS